MRKDGDNYFVMKIVLSIFLHLLFSVNCLKSHCGDKTCFFYLGF